MASGFEVGSAVMAVVTTFHKSAIILTVLKGKRNAQEKKAFMNRRMKLEVDQKAAETELEICLQKGADEILRDFNTYCDRFTQDFSIGDKAAQLRFNEIKEEAKSMYRILEFARELDFEDCQRLRAMAEGVRRQTQSAMAEFQLRLLQSRPANAPSLHVHPAFQTDSSKEPPQTVDLPLRDSLLYDHRSSAYSERRPSFETMHIEIEAWPQPPNSSGSGHEVEYSEHSDDRRSTFTSSINSSEDSSDGRSRAGTSWSSYTSPMTPMTPLTPGNQYTAFPIPAIQCSSDYQDEQGPGRISPVIEETKSQIYSIEQQSTTSSSSHHLGDGLLQPRTPTPRGTVDAPMQGSSLLSARPRSQSDAPRSKSPVRPRSPFHLGSAPGGLSALGMVPMSSSPVHKRNASEADARGAIIAASATLSSVASNTRSSTHPIPEYDAPKRSNEYHGFCKGSWKINEKGTKGLSAERRPIGGGIRAYEMFWQCKDCRFQGLMPNPRGKERLPDTRVRLSKSGIQYRWMFLAKCHTPTKASDPWYRCLICFYESQRSDAHKGEEALMQHIAYAHSDEVSIEIQRRTGAIQGRKPHPGEEWELFIPPRGNRDGAGSLEASPRIPSIEVEPARPTDPQPVSNSDHFSAITQSIPEEESLPTPITTLPRPDNIEKTPQTHIRDIDEAAYRQYRVDRVRGAFSI